MATRNTPTTSTLEEWRVEFNELATDVGNVSASSQGDQLTTSATDIVGAINELETNFNDLSASSSVAADNITTGDAAVSIATSSGNITIDAAANNTDIIFKGTDATADITMLTLDGSEAGAATFNSAITGGGLLTTGGNIVIPDAGNIGSASDTDAISISSGGVVTFSQPPSLTEIDSGSTITLDATTDIVLDADGGDVFFKDDGTTFGSATNTSGNLIVKSGTTTALTFSGANVTAAGTIDSGAITSTGTVTGTGFTIGSAAIDETELEILDGANVTTTEINLLDGSAKSTSSITLADADACIVIDGSTTKQIPASDIRSYAGGANYNAIINGDMTVFTRNGGGTITSATTNTNADDSYTLDRWILLSDTDDVVDVGQGSSSYPSPGSGRFISLDVETINKKFGIAQIVEFRNCSGLLGSTVSLSFKAKVSDASKLDNVKAGVIAWDGTMDSVTSDVVSAWGVEDTNPTLATDCTFENTPTNLSVTTSWATYKIENISVDTTDATNLIVFIWSDVTDTTAGHFLYITDVQLEPGATANDFVRKTHRETLTDCQRYYWEMRQDMPTYGSTGVLPPKLPVYMRVTPTFTWFYAGYNGTANRVYRLNDANTADLAASNVQFLTNEGMKHWYNNDTGSYGTWASVSGDDDAIACWGKYDAEM